MSPAFRFDLEWRTTLFALLLVPALAGLGLWQLSRAEEKSALRAAFEAQQALPPATLDELAGLPAAELGYRPVQLTGRYRDEEYFLLDNRLQHGRYGNEVIAVFELEPGPGLALVNRGWMAADPARTSLPEAPAVAGTVSVRAQVYIPPGKPYLLRELTLPEGWPKRVQAVQVGKLGTALGGQSADLFPHLVRLDAGEPGALSVAWQVVNVSPAKHIGYAVQWFLMSAVLAVIFVFRSSNLRQWLQARRKRNAA
jgi:cytochrome oxidase assembly protein ShyY1